MGSVPLVTAALKRLEGKVAVITGGASGIGETIAKLFSQHGAKIVVGDIQDDLGHAVCRELDSAAASFVHCDVTKEEDVEKAVNTAVSMYGKLDIMVNNAGISGAPSLHIRDNEKADLEQVLGVNLVGPFLGTKHAARVMIPSRGGSIITTASGSSVLSGVAPHAYTISKHGVVGLMRNTAAELAQYGIRVNCVSPHYVATPMTKDFFDQIKVVQDTMLQPRNVADVALFLASDDSKYVSGQNLVVDGGFGTAFSLYPRYGSSHLN